MTPQQIDAMKLALEALEDRSSLMKWQKARDAVKEALAEHAMREVQRLGQEIEQVPIGFVPRSVIDWLSSKHRSLSANITTTIWVSPDKTAENAAIFISPPPRTEPLIGCVNHDCDKCKERKPLTDDWIRAHCAQTWVFETVKQWVRAIEAAHGIKENT